jgi:SAM-dependent methyltransferase
MVILTIGVGGRTLLYACIGPVLLASCVSSMRDHTFARSYMRPAARTVRPQRSPGARFTSIDHATESVAETQRCVDAAGLTNVDVRQADIFHLPFPPKSFDRVFVCFVREHLSRPVEAMTILRRLLRPGGTMTVIEGTMDRPTFTPKAAPRTTRSDAKSSFSSGRAETQTSAGNSFRSWSRRVSNPFASRRA